MNAPASARPCSIAVVGCGYWGPNYVRNFSGLPNAEVRAVCDPDRKRMDHLRSLYPDIPQFHSVDEMLEKAVVDAVVIATPVKTHFELAKQCLLAGKHTLIEKPMASSSAQCEELVAIAHERKVTLMVGHTYLYSEPINRIKEIVSRGDIGRVLYINAQRLNLGLFQKDINVAWDLAPHDLSIILYLLDKVPTRVNCQGNAHVSSRVEDVTNISLGFDGSESATIQSSWLEPRKVRQMTIVGDRRMIVYDDLEPREKIRIYDTRVERPPHYDSYAQFHYSYHYGDCYIPHLHQEEPLQILCRHFLECITTGARPRSCGRQGTQLVKILEACSQSLLAGGAPMPLGDANSPETHHPVVNSAGARELALQAVGVPVK